MSALAQIGHELLRCTCLLLALSGHHLSTGSPAIRAAAAVADRLMFSETTGLFGLAQDVKTRQRNPTVPKIDMGMAMMTAPTTIAARRR